MGRGMIYLAAILILAGLTWFFDGALDRQVNPNQRPQSSVQGSIKEVVLDVNRHDQYVVTARINGTPVDVLVDTGATEVALSERLARSLNLEQGPAVMISTANGVAQGHQTLLDEVRVGDISVNNIRAMVVPNMSHPDVLLGMNFLRDLEMIQRDGQLILRQ